jgi:hypothetical protein
MNKKTTTKTRRDQVVFDFDQYRKLMLAKAVCIDHEKMEICFLEGIKNGSKPFMNVVMLAPGGDDFQVIHETNTKFPFRKELMIKWNQRFPSIATYMTQPCRGYKMVDIDIEDTTYCDEQDLSRFQAMVEELNRRNTENSLIPREHTKEYFGLVRRVGNNIIDKLCSLIVFDETDVYFTGRGYQLWAEYDEPRIRQLMRDGLVCSSNEPNRKAQRLFSPMILRMGEEGKGHMQTCVRYDEWRMFKFSNPAFFKLTSKQLRALAMEFQKALLVSNFRSGELDHEEWYDMMENKQMSVRKEILDELKI